METRLGRRHALATLGASGLGVLLSACGGTSEAQDSGGAGNLPGSTTTLDLGPGDIRESTVPTSIRDMFEEANTCGLTPAGTEGPFYMSLDMLREDITEDEEGVPLLLAARILNEQCQPIQNALFEIWQANAEGLYSGFEIASARGIDEPPAANTPVPPNPPQTDELSYLRGGQQTDADGIAMFRTIWPGWYNYRAAHIHAKVWVGSREVLTVQLYLPDEINDAVAAEGAYDREGVRLSNGEDSLYTPGSILTIRENEEGEGYIGLINITVLPAATDPPRSSDRPAQGVPDAPPPSVAPPAGPPGGGAPRSGN